MSTCNNDTICSAVSVSSPASDQLQHQLPDLLCGGELGWGVDDGGWANVEDGRIYEDGYESDGCLLTILHLSPLPGHPLPDIHQETGHVCNEVGYEFFILAIPAPN